MFFDNASSATLIINFTLFLITIYFSNVAADAIATDADNRLENVTVFLKSWPFRLVRKECESSFLYNYGYTSVLVSSIQDKTLLKRHSEDFQFDDLFKFRTPLGTTEEFSSMIKSCEKNGIKVYVSLKLITDKQIDQVVKKYEEIEPFLLRKLAQRIKKSREAKAAIQNTAPSPKKVDVTSAPSPMVDSDNAPTTPRRLEKPPKKPVRFDENFMKKRQHKNTKYLIELALLNAAKTTRDNGSISSLIQSFKQVNKQYRLRYKRNKILSENSPVPGLVRKYCKLKYKLEDISSAVQFVKYLAELGVSGVRIENSRYIDTAALNDIFTSAQKQIPHKMAIIFDDVVNVKHYQKFGSIMDEAYARNLMNAVKKVNFQKLVSKQEIWPRTWWNVASSDKSRPFVPKYMIPEDNKSDSYNFKIATSMMLVNPHGFPIIVSPYSRLKKHINSLPNADSSDMKDICSKGKFCIHRKKFIRQLVLFRLITTDDKITSVKALRNNILYLNRGDKGFAAFIHKIPSASKDKTVSETLTIQTELPPGLYCNIIAGYPDLKRGQCNPGSVIQVDMKQRIIIKNPNTYDKGVLAIDILVKCNRIARTIHALVFEPVKIHCFSSRVKYVDIEANGKYIFQTKPSSKQLPDKGHDTGSNFKPRDVDDLQDEPINPTLTAPNPARISSDMQTRDLDDVLRVREVKFEFGFGGLEKIFEKGFKFFYKIVEEILDFIKDVVKNLTRGRHKYPKLEYDYHYHH